LSARPSTRALLLLFLPVASLLIVALWAGRDDDDPVAGDGSPAHAGRAAGRPSRVTSAEDVPGALTGSPARLPAGDEESGTGAVVADDDHFGRVRGRLVDGQGRAVPGEPVFLLGRRDPWERGEPRTDDPTPLARLLARTTADDDGRFALPAQAGVVHELLAGGRDWARVKVDDVVSGDELDVVLRDGNVLEGQVRDELTLMPVADAWVLALVDGAAQLGRAGADGRFRLGPLPELVVLVGAYSEGSGVALADEVLPAQGELLLDLPPGAPLEGRLVDADSGGPVAGGEVEIVLEVVAQMLGGHEELPDTQPVERRLLAADEDGRFDLSGGPQRGFVLEARAPDYVPVHYDRYKNRTRDDDDVIELRMQRAEPLVGKVVVAQGGAPAAGARVEAHAPQGLFATTVTGEQGGYSLATVDWDGHGPLYVHARDAEGRTARRRVGKREDPVDLQLVAPVELLVEVVRGDEPVAGASVAARSGGALTTTARTGPDGRATLVHELAGADVESVEVQARHGAVQSVPVEVALDELHDGPREGPDDGPRDGPEHDVVRVELDAGDWLHGWVSDAFGAPVGSAALRVRADPRSASRQVLVGHADGEGGFRLGPLAPDLTWQLTVTSEDHRTERLGRLAAGPDPVYVRLAPVVTWSGRVVDGVTGKPATGFSGQLMQEVADPQRGGTTRRNTRERLRHTPGAPGEFSFALPEAGRYVIRIVAKDSIPAESVPSDTNGVTPPPFVELMLWPAAVLDVTVQDGRGRPVQGFEVTAVPWALAGDGAGPSDKARKIGVRTRTGADGVAHFNLGQGGDYRIAGGPGAWLDATRVQALPGVGAQRLYRLPATGDLELTIVDQDARPLGGVMVELRSSRDEQAHSVYRRTGMRDGSGAVAFDTVPPGTYTVRLRRRGYSSSTHDVFVRGNAIERVRLAMEPRQTSSEHSFDGTHVPIEVRRR
jgi:hypothetical protein